MSDNKNVEPKLEQGSVSVPPASTAPAGPQPAPTGGEFVQVKREDLDKLFAQLDRNQRDIDLLVKAADKSRLAQARQQESGPLIHTCKIWRSNFGPSTGKFMVAWKLISNVSEIVAGRWVEDQRVTTVFEDGATETVTLQEFYLHREPVVGEIMSRETITNEKGEPELRFKIQLKDGKELVFGEAFIN